MPATFLARRHLASILATCAGPSPAAAACAAALPHTLSLAQLLRHQCAAALHNPPAWVFASTIRPTCLVCFSSVMHPASSQKGLRSGWQSGASEPHLLTRRCFPMVRVLPFRASACRSAHRWYSSAHRLHRSTRQLRRPARQFHFSRIGNLFHADFRFAPSRLEQHSIASRATLETPIHEGMGAHGLRGRVSDCA